MLDLKPSLLRARLWFLSSLPLVECHTEGRVYGKTLTVLGNTGQVFCRKALSWDLSNVFLTIRWKSYGV